MGTFEIGNGWVVQVVGPSETLPTSAAYMLWNDHMGLAVDGMAPSSDGEIHQTGAIHINMLIWSVHGFQAKNRVDSWRLNRIR